MRRRDSTCVGRGFTIWLACAFTTAVTGCGTIFSGTHQDLKLAMEPAGSELEVYRWSGERVAGPASAPGTLTVHRPVRGQPYLVRAAKAGHCPRYWITSSRATPGVYTYIWMMFIPALGPIVVGLTAALIDSASGGCCSVTPHQFDGPLLEDAACLK